MKGALAMCGCGCHLVAAKAEADREAALLSPTGRAAAGSLQASTATDPHARGRGARQAESSYKQMAREMWAALTGQVRQI